MSVLFELNNISKSFDNMKILDNVSFRLNEGEIHAIIGANGTGKTVLQSIITGMIKPDSGTIFLAGKPLDTHNPIDSIDKGITAIYEKTYLLNECTILQNIFLGKEPRKKSFGISYIDWRSAKTTTEYYLKKFNLSLDPDTCISKLPVGQQRIIEIIKALTCNAKLILIDEPTLFLSEEERATFFSFIKKVSITGTAFLILTNGIDDISAIVDHVFLLRDGIIDTFEPDGDRTMDSVWMTLSSKSTVGQYPKLHIKKGRTVLSVRHLANGIQLQDISFEIHKGEILGLAGLPGSGARTVGKTLFGLTPGFSGEINILEKPFVPCSSAKSKRMQIGYVSGINPANSLIMRENVSYNMSLPNLKRIRHNFFLNRAAEKELCSTLAARLRITGKETQQIEYLSGGNQRKVCFGRWIMANVKLLILDEPTVGMDVDARLDIYNIINELALSGIAILFISSNFQELAGMCDSIYVIKNGRSVGHLNSCENMEDKVWRLACGH